MSKESKHVIKFKENHLKKSEKVIVWGDGYIGEALGTGDKKQHNGSLVVTNERVAFYRKGFFGEVLETIPLNKITSIERKSFMGHQTICIHTSHDELKFKTFGKKIEQKLVDAIEAGREKIASSNVPISENSPLEGLKKLSELRELGIVTEEEFKEKKAELLSRL